GSADGEQNPQRIKRREQIAQTDLHPQHQAHTQQQKFRAGDRGQGDRGADDPADPADDVFPRTEQGPEADQSADGPRQQADFVPGQKDDRDPDPGADEGGQTARQYREKTRDRDAGLFVAALSASSGG